MSRGPHPLCTTSPVCGKIKAEEASQSALTGGKVMVDVMTDKQFKIILQMVDMILDGGKDLEEAKEKVQALIKQQGSKKDDD